MAALPELTIRLATLADIELLEALIAESVRVLQQPTAPPASAKPR
jgi:hypothetical protein